MAFNLGKAITSPIKTPKNIGAEVGSWFGVGPKAKPGALTGGSDQPIAGGALNPTSPTFAGGGLGNLEVGPPGGKTAAIPQVTDPYLEQAKAAAAGVAGVLPQYQSLYGAGAGAMTGLIGDLQRQARGEAGPGRSLAEALLQQGLTQNIGAVQSQLASQRGLSAAQRGRLAATQTAALQGQTAQQAGLMGLQQQLAAQDALAKLGTGAAQLGSDAQLRGAGLLTGQSTDQARIAAGISQANQAAQAADKARTTQAVTSVLGSAAQVGAAALAHGGRIDGEAPYPGDTPKNDVVKANLSPGEIVIPRSAAGSKKAAKAFIEALDDWDEEPSYGKVLKARQKKNYADGGKVDFPLGGPYAPVSAERMSAAYDQEIPAAQKMKQSFDQFLTERVVDPLAQRGYPTLGAALATVPSVAADVMIPSTTGELQGAVIPMPGLKKGIKKATEAAKGETIEKFLKGMASMGDDVDISRLKPELYKKYAKDIEKAKKQKVLDEMMQYSLENKPASFEESRKLMSEIVGSSFEGRPRAAIDLLAEQNLDIPEVKKAFKELQLLQFGERGKEPTVATNRMLYNAQDNAYTRLTRALAENKDKLKLSPELDELKQAKKIKRLPIKAQE